MFLKLLFKNVKNVIYIYEPNSVLQPRGSG